jgi:hypothetical protein
MPLPHPAGYRPRRQQRIDRRRIVFSSLQAAALAAVLLVLLHRAAHSPGQPLQPIAPLAAVLLASGVGVLGAWGETMRQLALTQRGERGGPE